LLFIFISYTYTAYCQQDIDFHITKTFLSGKNILKVKRDFKDPYLWVLAQNNEVYRINSTTYQVDDYTSQFSSYSGLQFIDIAGRSKDTVFIATNSTNILEYKTGIVKIIGTAQGVKGTVNSIGCEFFDGQKHFGLTAYSEKTLLIATNHGYCHYDFVNNTMLNLQEPDIATRIFESTYRTQIFDYLTDQGYSVSPKSYATQSRITYSLTNYRSYVWYGDNEHGYNINSVFITGSAYTEYAPYATAWFLNQLWATEKGLFRNNRNLSYDPQRGSKHYLDNIKINKITSIFGLTGYGNSNYIGLTQENILVGTDQGLYFSNSGYFDFANTPQKDYTFLHFDALGNKPINDICINAATYIQPVCEDGAWIATNNGLYYITPDYSAYITPTQQIKVVQFDGQPDTLKELQICSNDPISTKAIFNPFRYNNNIAVQWYKDGIILNNETNSSLNITSAGEYYCKIYDPCSNTQVQSNHLKVSVISAPTVTFNYPDQINYCNGTTATLQTDQNSIYQYRWYKNGIPSGNTTATLNTTVSGKYKVEVSACAGNWVSSKEVQINFITVPTLTISANKTAFCIGDQATLSTGFVNDGTYTIDWLLDGSILTGNQNKTSIITNQPGNYAIIISSKLVSCSQVSASYNLVFTPLPNINIQQIINTTFCDGQTINLQASYTSGNIKWSTGETTATIAVKHSGNYVATVTTAAGCIEIKNVNLQLFENPILTVPDATLCQFTNETITLTAPTGFLKYEWNGTVGNSTFSTNKLGSVNLVVTDNNGCKASQTINISGSCQDIHYPNTFTPNGDGINDNWLITGLENDPSASVRIYNRYGELVFESKGSYTPWDGTYKNKQVVTGSYYFIISAQKGKQMLSGSLTIIK
jgi:gliding motility-associated-like protein